MGHRHRPQRYRRPDGATLLTAAVDAGWAERTRRRRRPVDGPDVEARVALWDVPTRARDWVPAEAPFYCYLVCDLTVSLKT